MRALLIAAAVVLASDTLSAQTLDPALQKAQAGFTAAIEAADGEGFMRYTTDDFIYIGADGQMMTRAERMAANKGGVKRPPLTDRTVRVYGDMVITSGQGMINVRGVMQPFRGTSVWVKQNGEWKVAHTQNTVIAGKE